GNPGGPAVAAPIHGGRDNVFFLLRNRARRFTVPVDAATLPPLDPPSWVRGLTDFGWAGPSGLERRLSMKLTRLRLLGFKSFVEPTDFLIMPAITDLAGPTY